MTWHNDIESEDFPKQKTKFSVFSTKYDDKKLQSSKLVMFWMFLSVEIFFWKSEGFMMSFFHIFWC